MKWVLCAWLIGCLGVTAPLKAQQKEVKFKTLSSKDGLSSSMTWSLAQDQHGFIWIGTYDGLNVYNGYEFKAYRHQNDDPNSISANFVSSLLFDSKNRLWVGSPGGFDLYDPEKDHFIHFSPTGKHETLSPNISWIYEDRQGTIWTGTSDGMNFLNEKSGQLERSPILDEIGISTPVSALLQDKSGRYWIGTENGLFVYFPKEQSYSQFLHDPADSFSLAHNSVYALLEDRKGNIWIGTSGGLDLYLPEKKGFTNFKNNSGGYDSQIFTGVRSIQEGNDGNLWIGTYDGGLKKFYIQSQTFVVFQRDGKDPHSLADNSVKDILIDEAGGIWAATFRGISYADDYQLQFDHFAHKAYDSRSLTDNWITSLFKDSNNEIWVGNRFGISHFNSHQNNFTHYIHHPDDPTSISDGAILAITEDPEGNFWTVTHTGVVDRFDREKKNFYQFKVSPENNSSIKPRSNFVLCTKDGNVWVSYAQGISLYNRDQNNFKHFPVPDSLHTGAISFLFEDSNRNLWVVSYGAIHLFNRENNTFQLAQVIPEEMLPFQATHLYEDRNNTLWIGSAYKGLISYNLKNRSSTLFTNNGDLPNLFIKGILEDKEGNLWISSGNGLCHFNPNTRKYKEYGLEDGLKNSEFNTGVCIQAADGKMWFGGHNGISLFYPDQILNNPNPPKVAISNFQLFNKKVPIGENSPLKKSITETTHIDLDYTQSVISFEFVALNYNAPEKNQYAYRMLGFEEEWNYSGNRRHATYTNLPPGKTYTFQVKASNNDGVWNEEGASLEIYIKPPFWATWWFHSLLVLCGLGVLYGLYRWRTRTLYHQRRTLERKVKERTEEVEAQKEELAAHAAHLKNANKEIKHKNRKILRQANKLKALDQLKSKFLANISHEFRTPLTLILVPLEEMLSRSQADGNMKGQLSLMDRNARRLLQLINQLLDLSKLESGSIPLEMTYQNIVPFVKSFAMSFEAMAKKHNINLEVHCQEEEIVTSFDADKLEKIIFNLLSNAFKFTPEGGSIRIGLQSINLTDSELLNKPVKQQNYVRFTVSDTGSGISAEHLAHIFDRFYQAEPSLVRKSAGTGIGLSLTKELVLLHGGQIKVTSEPGQGTCFTVLLPITEPTPDQVRQTEADHGRSKEDIPEPAMEVPEEIPVAESFPDQKEEIPLLLVVEDNEDLRQQIKRIFSGQYRVEEAADGDEGWDKAIELMPDFIISDVMMPGKDGFDLCHQLKTNTATSHIPTILLSARIDGEETGLRKGADDYITKPFNAKALELKVKNLLETRNRFKEAICRDLGIVPLSSSTEPETVTEQDQQFIIDASEIAQKHLTNTNFDLEVFYRELGMSRTLVYNKLKSLTGLGPNEFIRQIRLNKASTLLVKGDLTIAEVMDEVGFNHRSYFVKCFKNEFGHLPSEHAAHQKKASKQDKETLPDNSKTKALS